MRGNMEKRVLEFSVKLVVQFREEDGYVLARSPDLDIYSQGETKEEAERNIVEAIQLFLESCYRRGVLDDTLQECGLQPIPWRDGPSDEDGGEMISVPLPLLAQGSGNGANHAS